MQIGGDVAVGRGHVGETITFEGGLEENFKKWDQKFYSEILMQIGGERVLRVPALRSDGYCRR